jgi:hypothetical protein
MPTRVEPDMQTVVVHAEVDRSVASSVHTAVKVLVRTDKVDVEVHTAAVEQDQASTSSPSVELG